MTENLVLEHLRHIRGKVDQIADDVSELKYRLGRVEGNLAGLQRNDADQQGDIYHQNAVIDAIKERLQRIENRLELQNS